MTLPGPRKDKFNSIDTLLLNYSISAFNTAKVVAASIIVANAPPWTEPYILINSGYTFKLSSTDVSPISNLLWLGKI